MKRVYEIHIRLQPQKKGHSRCVRFLFSVEGEDIQEARNKVLNRLLSEGYNLKGYKFGRHERMSDSDEYRKFDLSTLEYEK